MGSEWSFASGLFDTLTDFRAKSTLTPFPHHFRMSTRRFPMRIHSDSFENGKPIPSEFAMGASGGFGGNRNPQLAWGDAPAATKSFVLMCIDTDAPTDGALAANADVPIPVDHPRGDFVHWVVANMPADMTAIAAGGRGRRGPPRKH